MPVSIRSRSGCWRRSRSCSRWWSWSARWSAAPTVRTPRAPGPPRRPPAPRRRAPATGPPVTSPGGAGQPAADPPSAGWLALGGARVEGAEPAGAGRRPGRFTASGPGDQGIALPGLLRCVPGRIYAATLLVRASRPGTLLQVSLLEVAGGRRVAFDTIGAVLTDARLAPGRGRPRGPPPRDRPGRRGRPPPRLPPSHRPGRRPRGRPRARATPCPAADPARAPGAVPTRATRHPYPGAGHDFTAAAATGRDRCRAVATSGVPAAVAGQLSRVHRLPADRGGRAGAGVRADRLLVLGGHAGAGRPGPAGHVRALGRRGGRRRRPPASAAGVVAAAVGRAPAGCSRPPCSAWPACRCCSGWSRSRRPGSRSRPRPGGRSCPGCCRPRWCRRPTRCRSPPRTWGWSPAPCWPG